MTPHHLWIAITDFGDSAVLIPLAGVVVMWIAQRHGLRLAVLWGVLLGLDAGVVALTKIAFMGWGIHPPGLDFTGLSGHSALSMLVWPTIGALLAAGQGLAMRRVLTLLGFLLAAAIVMSRLAIDVHTPPEAALGALWGAALALLFLVPLGRATPTRSALAVWLLPLALALPLVLTYGRIFPTNALLETVACALSGRAQPYTRADLPCGRIPGGAALTSSACADSSG
ncbi:phosphatase PAP2 family protein [Thiomonas bhubaneswarensis]|uniref:Phosphatidic acid phosphatase type 2/haloperoxidase domain-containing protein n=1 Tax=Thiomonas bhubaneswarensis TaxID=339866 RepID=A0A0K6IAF0_9BURK|nr:phosphatase PAP2 family protein [Thiomonas bhubaneswarensis]CUB00079.1 hypothetical protein Ga0061069_11145 [Thiomonas bhubaneswarensis]